LVFKLHKVRMLYCCLSLHMWQNFWKSLGCKPATYHDSYSHELQEGTLFSGRSAGWIWQTTLPESCRFIDVSNDWDKAWHCFCYWRAFKFVSKPSLKHLIAAKRVIRYLKFTKDFRLQYSRGRSRESLDLFEYCDASWECQDDGKSEQVICLKLTLVLWPGHPRSILQLLSLYCWSRVHCSLSLSLLSLIWDLGFVQRFPTNTYEDKQSYIAIAKE